MPKGQTFQTNGAETARYPYGPTSNYRQELIHIPNCKN